MRPTGSGCGRDEGGDGKWLKSVGVERVDETVVAERMDEAQEDRVSATATDDASGATNVVGVVEATRPALPG